MAETTPQPEAPESPTEEERLRGCPASPARPARTRSVVWVVAAVLAVFAVFFVLGVVQRLRSGHALSAESSKAASSLRRVAVIYPVASSVSPWSLPGTTQAMKDAVIYARVSGYLTKRYVDIGDAVKAGQLLAEIESPELEQQLSQARATLQQAEKQLDLQKANLELARTTMERYQGADREEAVAKLAVDQAVATFRTAEAAVAAAQASVYANQATVRQYEALTAFERVLSPFDGIITQRNIEVGALITAGSPTNNVSVAPTSVTGAATGLFVVSEVDELRVFVSIPQAAARNVTIGTAAQVLVRGSLNAPVAATVARTANAVDPRTRTLLTEVDIPNASRGMLPGEFVYVDFNLALAGQRWKIPATALIFNSGGTGVMLVGPQNKLHLQKVTVGRDFGDTIDIQAGLSGGELIVEQPDVSLQDGQMIVPVESQHGTHS